MSWESTVTPIFNSKCVLADIMMIKLLIKVYF